MRTSFVLPEEEGQRWEFKRADVLDPAIEKGFQSLLESIVGMWNGGGGRIVIGVDDPKRGRVVLGIPREAKARLDALKDRVLDSLEPRGDIGRGLRFTPRDVSGVEVLEIRVRRRAGRGPACLVERSGKTRAFLKRFGNRNRPMTRAELEEAFSEMGSLDPAEAAVAETERRLEAAMGADLQPHRPAVFLFGGGFGRRDPRIDLDREDLRALLEEPDPRCVRRDGWTWFTGSTRAPRRTGGRVQVLETGSPDDLYRHLQVRSDGLVLFRTALESLAGEAPVFARKKWPSLKGVLSGYALAETLYSLCWLLGRTAGIAGIEEEVLLEARLWVPEGWSLGPWGPGEFGYAHLEENWTGPLAEGAPSLDQPIHRVPATRLAEAPADVAFALLRDISFSFGYGPERVPRYDPERRRFSCPAAAGRVEAGPATG